MIRQQGDNFTFQVRCDGASEVFLAGDFNRWTIPGTPMVQVQPGVWEARCSLPTGMQRVGYFAVMPRQFFDNREMGGPLLGETTFDAHWLSTYDCVHVEEHAAAAC